MQQSKGFIIIKDIGALLLTVKPCWLARLLAGRLYITVKELEPGLGENMAILNIHVYQM